MRRKGGEVLFLQNSPRGVVDESSYSVVKHDISSGWKILCDILAEEYKDKPVKLIFLLGPEWSGPGPESTKVKKRKFKNGYDAEFVPLNTWTFDEALKKVADVCRIVDKRLVIVCANDDMAVAFSHWVTKENGVEPSNIDIVGYDGTKAAVAAISEPCNPMKFTLAIKPSDYGQLAAEFVREDFKLFPSSTRNLLRGGVQNLEPNGLSVVDPQSAQKTSYWYGLL